MKLHELDISLQQEILKCAGECLVKQFNYDGVTGRNQAAKILESVAGAFLQLYPDVANTPFKNPDSAPILQAAQETQFGAQEPAEENSVEKNQEHQETPKRPYNRRNAG